MSTRTLTDRLSLRQHQPDIGQGEQLAQALLLMMGALSWRAGSDTVDTLSRQLLAEAVDRISASLARHVGGADAVLETAFPSGLSVQPDVTHELDTLRERFWLATSIHRDPNNYVYYGDHHGHFLGLWRYSAQEAELRLRTAGSGPRTLFRFTGMRGELRAPVQEDRIFDPRERPWYQSAMANRLPLAWTPVYIDFKVGELVTTRTKRILNEDGEPLGVVATDLPLKQINALLSRVTLSEHAVALIVEADGQLIGVSRGAPLQAPGPGALERLHAQHSTDPLVADAYDAVRRLKAAAAGPLGTAPRTAGFTDRDGQQAFVGFSHVDPALGLDWTIVVAVPRADFLASVQRNFVQAGWLAAAAVAAVLLLGWAALGLVSRELRRLAEAAQRIGDGVLDEPPEVHRRDELGDLARSFAALQRRLLTDPLTGLCNRSAILRRIEDRILQQRRRGDRSPFAVLFIDFDHFKAINERFGHAVGDAVLQELGQRLQAGVAPGDLVARYASDEFVLLMASVGNRADAEAARSQLEASLQEPLASLAAFAAQADPMGASIGLALYPDDASSTEALLKLADADMYARKQGLAMTRTQALDLRTAPDDRQP